MSGGGVEDGYWYRRRSPIHAAATYARGAIVKTSRSAVTSIYAPCDVLDLVDAECDRIANGNPRNRPSRSEMIVRCIEQVLATAPQPVSGRKT